MYISHFNQDFSNIAFTLRWIIWKEILKVWKLSQYEQNFYPSIVTILKEKLKEKSHF